MAVLSARRVGGPRQGASRHRTRCFARVGERIRGNTTGGRRAWSAPKRDDRSTGRPRLCAAGFSHGSPNTSSASRRTPRAASRRGRPRWFRELLRVKRAKAGRRDRDKKNRAGWHRREPAVHGTRWSFCCPPTVPSTAFVSGGFGKGKDRNAADHRVHVPASRKARERFAEGPRADTRIASPGRSPVVVEGGASGSMREELPGSCESEQRMAGMGRP